MKIIAFSKHLLFNVGGAEKSIFHSLEKEHQHGADIKLVSLDQVKVVNAENKLIDFPDNWQIKRIKPNILIPRLPYWEYLVNRRKISKYFLELDAAAELYTYSTYAPIAILAYKGRARLFVRCENDLGLYGNYFNSIKRLIRSMQFVFEYPAFYLYKKDLKRAIQKADIICNSKYMRNRLAELYNKSSEVVYPYIDIERLRREYNSVKNEVIEKGIVYVDGGTDKGKLTVISIAKIMSGIKFYFFSKRATKTTRKGNITWIPWQKKEVDVYKYAKVVIVPSICAEGYGRVAREAFILGIPVLVSNRGGLPETIDGFKEYIIDNYQNPKVWKDRINKYINKLDS